MRNLLTALTALAALVVASVVGVLASHDASATNVQTVPTCHDTGWDFSDSKPFNSEVIASQFQADGLHVAVAGPSEKQSAYKLLASPVKLINVNQADTQLQYLSDHGYSPAYQLTTIDDPTDSTTWTGNLVYEDGHWWATRPQFWSSVPNPGQSGGASLETFKAAYPDRFVYQVGFSLGSGAAASAGVIKSLTFQGTMWVFTDDCTPPTSTTTETTTTTTETTTTTTTEPTLTTTTASSTSTTTIAPPSITPTYANCDEARAAGNAPINWDRPGFRRALDADGDGVGCEVNEDVTDVSDEEDLAYTGTSSWLLPIGVIGLLLLIAGATLLLQRRRRPNSDAR
jgi:excalibur calcium-binding domain-containing protein